MKSVFPCFSINICESGKLKGDQNISRPPRDSHYDDSVFWSLLFWRCGFRCNDSDGRAVANLSWHQTVKANIDGKAKAPCWGMVMIWEAPCSGMLLPTPKQYHLTIKHGNKKPLQMEI